MLVCGAPSALSVDIESGKEGKEDKEYLRVPCDLDFYLRCCMNIAPRVPNSRASSACVNLRLFVLDGSGVIILALGFQQMSKVLGYYARGLPIMLFSDCDVVTILIISARIED